MKKIAVLGTVGIPACYGGFESLVENLTRMSSKEISYTVFCSSRSYSEKLTSHNGADLIYLPFKANGFSSIIYDIYSMLKCIGKRYDAVLILGVSGCSFLPLFRLLFRGKIITNIDGLEWKRDKWGAFTKWFLKFSERLSVRYSDVIISDNKAISKYVFDEYKVCAKTIAYGGDHALIEPVEKTENGEFLSLCRIEPENNIHLILEAFKGTDKKLKFVGNWNNSEYGRSLYQTYSLEKNIELLEPIYDIDALFQLRSQVEYYVHGHSAGGTNPSLVEMMHFPVTVICYDCSFNRYSTNNDAVYFSKSEELREFILSNNIIDNSKTMNCLARHNYTWGFVVKEYESCY